MRDLTGNFGMPLDEVRGRTELGVFKSIKVTRAPDVARYLFTHSCSRVTSHSEAEFLACWCHGAT